MNSFEPKISKTKPHICFERQKDNSKKITQVSSIRKTNVLILKIVSARPLVLSARTTTLKNNSSLEHPQNQCSHSKNNFSLSARKTTLKHNIRRHGYIYYELFRPKIIENKSAQCTHSKNNFS